MKPIKVTTKRGDYLQQRILERCEMVNQRRKSLPEPREQYPNAWKVLDSLEAGIADDRAEIDRICTDEAVKAALAEVNGGAKSFTITSAFRVWQVARQVEAALEKAGLAASHRAGVTARYTPGGPTAKAYKYAAKSTTITLRRVSDGWRLVDIESTHVYPRNPERLEIRISKAQRDHIVAATLKPFTLD